jgi:DNA polymerase III epsilon subunit-like protein
MNSKIILCFDVETTGLPPKKGNHTYPYITQLSFILYDMTNSRLIDAYDAYINVPQEIEITEEITQLTGATREKCDAGVSMADAITAFHEAWMVSSVMVAHNMEFDFKFLQQEYLRNSAVLSDRNIPMLFDHPNQWGVYPEAYCTMKASIDICKLPKFVRKAKIIPDKTPLIPISEMSGSNIIKSPSIELSNEKCSKKIVKKIPIESTEPIVVPTYAPVYNDIVTKKPYNQDRYKYPTLTELYTFLFDETPKGQLHNSLIDTLVCLKCYMRIKHSLIAEYSVDVVSDLDIPRVTFQIIE